jgi:hypothetical protein
MDPRKAMCLLHHIGTRQKSLSASVLFSSQSSFWEPQTHYRKRQSYPIQHFKIDLRRGLFSLETGYLAPLA